MYAYAGDPVCLFANIRLLAHSFSILFGAIIKGADGISPSVPLSSLIFSMVASNLSSS